MKHYDNFDNTFFLKLICIISALALIFVIVIAAVGILTRDRSPIADGSEEETFIFGFSETSTPEEEDTEKAPPETEKESDTEPDTDTEVETEGADTTAPETDIETEAEIPPEKPSTILGESEDMGEEYIDSLIFVGSSTTYGLKAYGMLKDGKNTNQVWTTKSATLSLSEILTKTIIYPKNGKEMTISEAASVAKPEYMVINLGVEGVTSLSEEEFKNEYISLVEAIKKASPETKIILQSIFPVASSFTTANKLNNPLIDKANGWVLEVAEITEVRYLDTQSVLKDSEGALNPDYDNGGNGINLNDRGFTAVLNYIRTHGYK